MAKLLIRMTSPPYGSSNAADGLDFALAATNYGHEVVMLFEGNGIYVLLPQQPVQAGVKNLSKQLKSLPFFDIEECFYSAVDAQYCNVDSDALQTSAEAITDEAINTLINDCDHVVTF